MNVLIACEESQRVCKAFRAKGHNAYSCDIIEPSGGRLEWHIKENAIELINGNCIFVTMDGKIHRDVSQNEWDLIIAHPPCTYLSNVGARHLWKNHVLNQERYEKGLEAKKFFMQLYNAECPKIAIENPIPSRIYDLPRYTQIIQPYEYGHPYTKRTCLWLKNLPLLKPTNIITPTANWCPSGSYSKNHDEKHRGVFTNDRSKNRSKTFLGIAKAMASQWG